MADPKRFPSGPYDVVLGILQLALIIGIVSLRSLDALEKSLAGGGFIPIASTSLDYQAQQVVVDVSGWEQPLHSRVYASWPFSGNAKGFTRLARATHSRTLPKNRYRYGCALRCSATLSVKP
jgi:hypothetical protein